MGFASSEITKSAKPGQFVMVKIGEELNPLLRRPFSIHRIVKNKAMVEILYKVVGKGTRILSEAKEGDFLNILGPLGNGFRIASDLNKAIIVAGGMGVAPLYFLAEKISEKKGSDISILIGGKTKDDILVTQRFEKLGGEVRIVTEDGSLGHRGMVSEILKDISILATTSFPETHCFTCGPWPMMAKVAKLAKKNKIPCQVSLESRMACGIGACLGCVIETKPWTQESNSNASISQPCYRRVCKDGPVFNSEKVVW
jgi:dihydroorotate dehydrogenase electron transfer subunit